METMGPPVGPVLNSSPQLYPSSISKMHHATTPTPTPTAQHNIQQTSRLVALPDELLLCILDLVDDTKTYCALARVCRRLSSLADAYVYASVLIRTPADVQGFCAALARRSPTPPPRAIGGTDETDDAAAREAPRLRRVDRWDRVRELQIRYGVGNEEGMERMTAVLWELPNLRRLTIESPCYNDTHWRVRYRGWSSQSRIQFRGLLWAASVLIEQPQFRPLGALESLTLHSHASQQLNEMFDLGATAVVFLHPTLRHLHLSCFDIPPISSLSEIVHNLPSLGPLAKTTPLTHLVFDECNVSAEGLHSLLEYPRALRSLTLGERIHHFQRPPFRTAILDPDGLVRALAQQAHSLAHLKHTGARHIPELFSARLSPHTSHTAACPADCALGLSRMTALRTLELGDASCLRAYLLDEEVRLVDNAVPLTTPPSNVVIAAQQPEPHPVWYVTPQGLAAVATATANVAPAPYNPNAFALGGRLDATRAGATGGAPPRLEVLRLIACGERPSPVADLAAAWRFVFRGPLGDGDGDGDGDGGTATAGTRPRRPRSLRRVDVVMGAVLEDEVALALLRCAQRSLDDEMYEAVRVREAVFALGRDMAALKGVELRVFGVRGSSCIPPYMFGEAVPWEVLVYEAGKAGGKVFGKRDGIDWKDCSVEERVGGRRFADFVDVRRGKLVRSGRPGEEWYPPENWEWM
ncbi:hypothetical protein BDY21DRAFT_363514 [Lineolata rhizophorae]|uniref:F-box domain-containing protein n=1 Tax=Lineolata rhizophorae TaxID=578093 RepID=A0A6A6P1P0_9PEZI|nr:hypothetical protein BDY21DRAFT_363514 [Lineolata rhizophorae]